MTLSPGKMRVMRKVPQYGTEGKSTQVGIVFEVGRMARSVC